MNKKTRRYTEVIQKIEKLIQYGKVKTISLNNKDFDEIWRVLPECVKKTYPDTVYYKDAVIHRLKPPQYGFYEERCY